MSLRNGFWGCQFLFSGYCFLLIKFSLTLCLCWVTTVLAPTLASWLFISTRLCSITWFLLSILKDQHRPQSRVKWHNHGSLTEFLSIRFRQRTFCSRWPLESFGFYWWRHCTSLSSKGFPHALIDICSIWLALHPQYDVLECSVLNEDKRSLM